LNKENIVVVNCKTRFDITAFHEVLPYAANQIDLNLRRTSKAKLILLKISVRYNDEVGNSHSAPVDGVTNWGNMTKGAVRSYPGWLGRVWIFFSEDPHTHFCREFDNSLIHTGTGGYGLYNISNNIQEHIGHPTDLPNNQCDRWAYKEQPIYPLSFDCKIFIDDLPGYKAQNLLLGQGPLPHYEGKYESNLTRTVYSRSN
jgi:hypothetical protein